MGRLLLFSLLLALCISGTLQKKGKNGTKGKRNRSRTVGVMPRTFIGIKEKATNGSLASNSSQPTPALQLLSNATVEYLNGALSTRVIPVAYILAVTVGVPANVAILLTLASKVRKVSSAILYCSLATSDLLLLLCVLLKVHYHLRGNHWTLGEAACRAVTACFYANLYCSAQTLACISVKRYLAVVHPFMYKTLPKRACTACVSVAVWAVFGAAAAVPQLLVRQSYRLPELGRVTCHDVLPLGAGSHAVLLYYNLALTVLGLLTPLAVAAACYSRIVSELNRSHCDWVVYIKASSLVFVIFLVCFMPAGFLHFLHYVRLSAGWTENLYKYFNVAVCLCCLHACLDPFLFLLMSKSAGSKRYQEPFKSKSLSVSL